MPNLPNISPELLKAYQEEIVKRTSPATAKRKTSSLRRFFDWAHREGHIDENPLEKKVQERKPEIRYPKYPILRPINLLKLGGLVGLAVLIFLLLGKLQLPIPFRPAPATEEEIVQQIPQASPIPPDLDTETIILNIKEEVLKSIGDFSINWASFEDGNLLIGGTDVSEISLSTADTSDGDITINPDGAGIVHFLFEGTSSNFLNAQAPNLIDGSLYYGIVANNATGYDLIKLQSGSKPITRFSVDAIGDTYIGGGLDVEEDISTQDTIRLTSEGALTNITGYAQTEGNFAITQTAGETATITKKNTTALSDLLTLTLDERGKPETSNSIYSTLVLKRYDGAIEAMALLVDEGNAQFDGQVRLGRYSTNPDAIGGGSLVYNTADTTVYVWNGTSWVAIGGGSISGFWQRNSGVLSPATSTDDLAIGGTDSTAPFFVDDSGNVTIDGNTSIGDAASDTITFNAVAASTLNMNTNIITNIGNAATNFDSSGGLTLADNLAVNGGNITSTAAAFNLVNATPITLNIGGAATTISLGAATGTITINNATTAITGNLDVDGSTHDIAGTLNLSGSSLTTTGALSFTPGGALIVGATGQNLTLQGAVTAITSTGAGNDITLTAADDIVFNDLQLTSAINLTETDSSFSSGDTAIVDAINTAYVAATGGTGSVWTLDLGKIYPTTISNNVGIGTTTAANVLSKLYVTNDSTLTGKAVAIFDQTEDEDILTASASGIPMFVIDNSGNVGIGATAPASHLEILKADPEIRLTDTGDSEYTRITRSDTSGKAIRYNQVLKPAATAQAIDLEKDDSQWISVGDKPELDLNSGDWTIEGWFNLESDVTTYMMGKSISADKSWLMYRHSTSDDVIIQFTNDDSLIQSAQSDTQFLDTDGWVHFAATFDESENDLKLYRDGVLDGSNLDTSGNPKLNDRAVTIGGDAQALYGFDGQIQNVRVSNTIRYPGNFTSSTEVFANDANTLLLLWFDGDMIDQSDNGFDGTLMGTGSETYVTGTLNQPSSTEEVLVWSSEDGTGAGEEGIQTFGDPDGRSIVQGKTIRFNIGSSEKLRIDASGNVGIGITNPDGTLHVHTATAGTITASTLADDLIIENSSTAGISILAPSTNQSVIYFGNEGDSDEGRIEYRHANDDFMFFVGGASGGYRGDWTTSGLIVHLGSAPATPDGPLHVFSASAGTVDAHANANELIVENSADGGISILTPTTNDGYLLFGDDADNDVAGFIYDHGTGLTIRVETADMLKLTSSSLDFQQATSITTLTGDLTINSGGGQVIFADGDTLNIGGLIDVTYNAFANSDEAPEEGAIADDNDVYIGGDLEVDGTIYGTVVGSVAWDDLTDPDNTLSLSMAEYATTFTWNTAATAATLDAFTFAITNDATTDANTQRLLVLANNDDAGATGTTEKLLVLDNKDANEAVTTALEILASSTGTVTTAIDVSDAEIGTALAFGENDIDGTNFDVTGSTGSITTAGNIAVNGGNITSTGALNITPGGALIVGATGQNLTLQGAVTAITSTGAGNDITLTAADDIVFNDNQLSSAINLTEADSVFSSGDTAIVDAINTAYAAATGGTGSLWTDGGTYLYPTDAEVLGNSASAGANKIAGIYLADSSPLYFGTNNDISYSFSGTTLAVTTGTNDINFDANTLFIDGSEDRVGIGNTAPALSLEVGDITLGVDAASGVGIQGDLEVEDFALLGAVRIGSTGTDPDVGNLYVEGGITTVGDIAVNGGNITTTASIFNLVTGTATTVNFAQSATTISIGATTGTATIRNATLVLAGLLDVDGTASPSDIAGTLNLSGDILTSTTDLTIDPTGGGVKIGTGTADTIDLAGDDLYVTQDLEVDGTIYDSSGNVVAGYWTLSSSDLYATSIDYKVGIGTTSPTGRLHIATNTTTLTGKSALIIDQLEDEDILTASASGTPRLTVQSDGTLYFHQASTIRAVNLASGLDDTLTLRGNTVNIQGNTGQELISATPTEIVFNNPGNDVDLRAEGSSDTHLFFADAGEDAVGIGYTSLASTTGKLLVNGNVGIGVTDPGGALEVKATDNTNPAFAVEAFGYTNNVFEIKSVAGNLQEAPYVALLDGGTEKVVLKGFGDSYFDGGNVGIGITNPDNTLHVHSATAGTVSPSTYYDDLIVENSDHGGISILTPASTYGGLIFGSPSDNYAGWVKYLHSTNELIFGTSSGDRVKLTSSTFEFEVGTISMVDQTVDVTLNNAVDALNFDSNTLSINALNNRVGIGTTAPEEELTVIGDIQLGITDGTRYIYFDDGSADNAGFRYESGTDKMQFSHDGTTWSDMGTGGSGTSWWNETLGVLHPVNETLDLAVGATATDSAEFHVNASTGRLQAGGAAASIAYSRFGTSTTGHGLSAAQDVLISGKLEVNGALFPDSGLYSSDTGSLVLSFTGDDATLEGDLTLTAGGIIQSTANNNIVINAGTGTVLIGATGTGKLDAGVIDPVYDVGGEKFSTYMAGMVGLKEETTGSVETSQYIPGVGYKYTIDFKNQAKGSDLWLFSKTTDLSKHIKDLVVLLSPSGNTRTWYEVDRNNYTLSIYTSRPTTVSYRLTAPRFDSELWTNQNLTPESVGYFLDDNPLTVDGNGNINESQENYLADIEIVETENEDNFFEDNNISQYDIKDSLGNIIYEIGTLSKLVAANIKAGAIEVADLAVKGSVYVVDTIKAGAVETTKVTTNSFLAFQATIDNLLITNGLVSPVIETETISPIADSNLVIDLENSAPEATESSFGRLIIKGQDGAEVASIDAEGNATFSGTLEAEEVKTKEIVAGKIYADEIVARKGYFTETNTASISGITREEIEEILRQAEEDQKILASASTWDIYTATDSANLDELAINNLFVTEQAAINSLSVSSAITIGVDMVIQSTINDQQLTINNIDTLTAPLKLQSLALAPVEIMAGLIRIDTDGNVEISGNLYVAGQIEAGGLTLKQSADDGLQATEENGFGKLLSLQDFKGNKVASINASGAAQFATLTADKLIIAGADIATPSATTNGEIETNATAGTAVIPTGTSEITIRNPNVTDYTLVYVTPTSSTLNKVLYVKEKSAGYFVVGFSNPIEQDVNFNWWVIDVTE